MPHWTPQEMKELHTAMAIEDSDVDSSDLDCSDDDVQARFLPDGYDKWMRCEAKSERGFYLTVLSLIIPLVLSPLGAIGVAVGVLSIALFGGYTIHYRRRSLEALSEMNDWGEPSS